MMSELVILEVPNVEIFLCSFRGSLSVATLQVLHFYWQRNDPSLVRFQDLYLLGAGIF